MREKLKKGEVFGYWKILEDQGCSKTLVQCSCGKIKTIDPRTLKKGESKSCGCLRLERLKARIIKHGHCANNKPSKEYLAWQNLKSRCLDSNWPQYHHYGGRGIRVSRKWQGKNGFINFIADMGKAPTPKHSIDRINNDGNYCKKNCRWTIGMVQSLNSRSKNKTGFKGVTLRRDYKNPELKHFRARIKINGKTIWLGQFKSAEEASYVYQKKVREIIKYASENYLSLNDL